MLTICSCYYYMCHLCFHLFVRPLTVRHTVFGLIMQALDVFRRILLFVWLSAKITIINLLQGKMTVV